MPAEQNLEISLASFRYSPMKLARSAKGNISPSDCGVEPPATAQSASSPTELKSKPIPETKTDYSDCDIYYPMTRSERESFRTKAGKRVPPHHWAVYDLIRTIPAGKVSTYKDVSAALKAGSPRSVGGALRNNPFAPCIPCHRVISSSFSAGGFKGEWASSSTPQKRGENSTAKDEKELGAENWHRPFRGGGMGPLQNEKVRMLAREGVGFARDGKLVSPDVVWRFDGGVVPVVEG